MLNLGVIMDRKLWLGTVLTWTLVCLCNTPVGAAWIDLGGDGVTVSLMESDGARSVIEITLGGFDAEPVDIDGQTYYLISLAREGLEKEAGYPELPSVRRSLIIPDDREMAVSVLSSEHVEFTDLPVAPSKGHLLRTVDPATVPYHFDAFYQSAGTYPAAAVEANAPYILRDYRGMVVDANVLQYSPATQTLRVYTRMVIEVRPVGPGSINVLERSGPIAKMDRQFTNLYRDHFLNFGADSRYMPVLEDGGLLIITYDAFLSSIQPLAAWKLQKGIPTKLVTLSDTGPSYSQIRNYILAEYQDWGLSYVLLVGDGAQLPKYGSDFRSWLLLAGRQRQLPGDLRGSFLGGDPRACRHPGPAHHQLRARHRGRERLAPGGHGYRLEPGSGPLRRVRQPAHGPDPRRPAGLWLSRGGSDLRSLRHVRHGQQRAERGPRHRQLLRSRQPDLLVDHGVRQYACQRPDQR